MRQADFTVPWGDPVARLDPRLTKAAVRQRAGESQRGPAVVDLTQDKVSRRQPGAQPWSLGEVDALSAHRG